MRQKENVMVLVLLHNLHTRLETTQPLPLESQDGGPEQSYHPGFDVYQQIWLREESEL